MALPDIDTGKTVNALLSSDCVPVGSPCIFFDTNSTSKYGHTFEVQGDPLQIIAFDLPEGDSITLEMVWGEGPGQFFAPVVVAEAYFEIAHPNNVMMIPMEGHFRLRYDGELGEATVVCSPTSCCVAQIFPGAERMTALTPAQLAERLGFRDCNEVAITPGQRLATCANIEDLRADILASIPTVPTIPTTLPPSGAAGGALTGTYPNPGLVPAATLAATGLRNCDGAPLTVGEQVATCADLTDAIAAIPPGGSSSPTGPAGGGLNGTYPNPGLVPAAVVTATGFVDCDGDALTPGVALATCADLTDAIAAIPPGGSSSPTGPAGGGLNGTYPNPGLVPAAVAAALAQVDCDGAAIGVGAALATCANLADAIAAIPPGGSSTPTGPAGGGLNGTYPNPGLLPAAVAAAHGLVDCDGAAVGVGAAVATCANLNAAIASSGAVAGADYFTVGGIRQHWGIVGPINLANTPQTNPVLFATPFPAGQVPVNIQLTPLNNQDGGDSDDEQYWVIPGSITETGFSIGTRGDGPAVSFQYLAIAPTVSGGGGGGGGGGTIAPVNAGAFPIIETMSQGDLFSRTELMTGGPFTSVTLQNDGGMFPNWLNATNGGNTVELDGNATGIGTFTFNIQVCNAGGCQVFTGNEIEII